MHNIRHFCVPSHFLLKAPCEQILFSSVTSLEKCSLEGAVLTQLWLAELRFNPESPQLQRPPPSTATRRCLFSQNILVSKALKSGVWGLCMCSVAKLCPTLRLHGLQLPRLLSMGFPKQEYWSGLPLPHPGDLPAPGIKPVSPALAAGFFTTSPPEEPGGLWTVQAKISETAAGLGRARFSQHPLDISHPSSTFSLPVQGSWYLGPGGHVTSCFFFSFWPQAPAVISSRIYNSEFSSFLRSCNG